MQMPQDEYLLVSLANTKLRDEYSSPEELCAELCWDLAELNARLLRAGYVYDQKTNSYKNA